MCWFYSICIGDCCNNYCCLPHTTRFVQLIISRCRNGALQYFFFFTISRFTKLNFFFRMARLPMLINSIQLCLFCRCSLRFCLFNFNGSQEILFHFRQSCRHDFEHALFYDITLRLTIISITQPILA